MKQKDLFFLLIVVALFLPFALSETLYQGYQSFNTAHGMVMSFIKFAILSTMGELLGLRKNAPTPPEASPRTAEYYKTRPCVRQIISAARIYAEQLERIKG